MEEKKILKVHYFFPSFLTHFRHKNPGLGVPATKKIGKYITTTELRLPWVIFSFRFHLLDQLSVSFSSSLSCVVQGRA